MQAAPGGDYPPIGDYGLIGDCRTAALVSRSGSIDWLCLPHFSGPSIFAAILDPGGGHFQIRPTQPFRTTRRYLPDTNVLETTFHCEQGTARIIDCLTLPAGPEGSVLEPMRELLRVVEIVEGRVGMEAVFRPRPDYGRVHPRLVDRGALGMACQQGGEIVYLHGDWSLTIDQEAAVASGREWLEEGEKRVFSLVHAHREAAAIPPLGTEADRRLAHTVRWWQEWSGQCRYPGPYSAAVQRSALTLKMLTFALSGAVVAAPTASLPEVIGGVRNWDYRYCWLRDAALTLRAFFGLGYRAEGEGFLEWLLHATRLTWPRLQVLYDVYGRTRLRETELAHLAGYRGSSPVRVGNGACSQHQLDVYGEVILSACDYVEGGGGLGATERRALVGFGRTVCRHWRMPDHGVWEVRRRQQNTHSKLMCWVALDRLIRLHEGGHVRGPVARFRRERERLRQAIEERGFNGEKGSYVGVLDGNALDASLLLMGIYGYADPRDRRLAGTLTAIDRELGEGGLLRRYGDHYDGLPGREGAFGIVSFWAVDLLARQGRVTAARERFETLLEHANDLGLFGEEIDLETGEPLGNFPQAFTQVGLITAALSLQRAMDRDSRGGTDDAR